MKDFPLRRLAACLVAVGLAGSGGTLWVRNCASAADAPKPLRETKPLLDKTLVAWVYVTDTNQQGGSVLTVMEGEAFDAVVFGERQPGRWMAGSDFFRRTQTMEEQARYPNETADG